MPGKQQGRVVVEIRGGNLERVFDSANGEEIQHTLIDWDNIEGGDPIPGVARKFYPHDIARVLRGRGAFRNRPMRG